MNGDVSWSTVDGLRMKLNVLGLVVVKPEAITEDPKATVTDKIFIVMVD